METRTQELSVPIQLWPPSQKARLMLVEQLAVRLFFPSAFSVCNDLFSQVEAKEVAIKIEDQSFVTANEHYAKEPGSGGISAVQLYGKLSGTLMEGYIGRGPSVFVITESPSIKENRTGKKRPTFIKAGEATFIKADEAKKLLKPLERPRNSYTKIHFGNLRFRVDAAHVAAPILVSLKDQLSEVDLSNFFAGMNDEAIQVMKIFSVALEGCVLKSLDLSNNVLGEEGVRAFEALLKSQSSLEKLYLMNVRISGEVARIVCELIPSTQDLKVLHFDEDDIGVNGAVAIAKVVKCSPALEDFRCSSTCVGQDGGFALTDALGTCTNLKKLNLSRNMFYAARNALSTAVSSNGITEVYLSYMHLGDCFAIAIANVLKDNAPSLEVLDMAGNNITIGAVSVLAACISSKEFITKLYLSENELKNEGAIMIGETLKQGHGQLKEIDLSSNGIRMDGARILAETVVHKPKCELLNMNGNYLSVDGIAELKEILKKTPHVLGPLDKNHLDGDNELGLQMKNLDIGGDD